MSPVSPEWYIVGVRCSLPPQLRMFIRCAANPDSASRCAIDTMYPLWLDPSSPCISSASPRTRPAGRFSSTSTFVPGSVAYSARRVGKRVSSMARRQ